MLRRLLWTTVAMQVTNILMGRHSYFPEKLCVETLWDATLSKLKFIHGSAGLCGMRSKVCVAFHPSKFGFSRTLYLLLGLASRYKWNTTGAAGVVLNQRANVNDSFSERIDQEKEKGTNDVHNIRRSILQRTNLTVTTCHGLSSCPLSNPLRQPCLRRKSADEIDSYDFTRDYFLARLSVTKQCEGVSLHAISNQVTPVS